MSCPCHKYLGQTKPSLADADRRELRANLELQAREDRAYGREVSRCRSCGTQWVMEFQDFRLSEVAFFSPLPSVDPDRWLAERWAEDKIEDEKARERNRLTEFKRLLNVSRLEERCRNCESNRMKWSVFCPEHHWENSSGALPEEFRELMAR